MERLTQNHCLVKDLSLFGFYFIFNSRTLPDALDQLVSQTVLVSVFVAVTESSLGQRKDLVHLTGRNASRRGRQGRG